MDSRITENITGAEALPNDPLQARKKLATLFESYLIAHMQQGQVDADAAKSTAEKFVAIFQNATSPEMQQEAIDTLAKNENDILQHFGLKVLEMKEIAVKHGLYQAMLTMAQSGDISGARSMYKLFDSGQIHDSASLQIALTAQQNSQKLLASSLAVKAALESKGKKAAAEQLDQLIKSNSIQSQADLDKWQALIPGYIPQTSLPEPAKAINIPMKVPAPLSAQNLTQLQKLWEGIHRLDQQLRDAIGLKKQK